MPIAVSNLPLHPGKAPRWLFRRMVALADGIMGVMVEEFGTGETVRRLADPFWFQSLSCVLGFDWHSSGTTTVTMGALKQVMSDGKHGIYVCGGKGRSGRNVPEEVLSLARTSEIKDGTAEELIEISRLSAKVDSALVQDGYEIYHHNLITDDRGNWAVIQQGMNDNSGYARRYQWASLEIKRFFADPHTGILGDKTENDVLNMAAGDSEESRKTSVDLVNDFTSLRKDIARLVAASKGNTTLFSFTEEQRPMKVLDMPLTIDWDLMKRIYDFHPTNYRELVEFKGVGKATVRALALISDLIYGSEPSWRDPVKYTFTVGGKDGVPYPVDRKAMDQAIEVISQGIAEARAGSKEKLHAMRRLRTLIKTNNT